MNSETLVWDIVLNDINERRLIGRKKYGTELQPFNGRNASVDLFQELLDSVVYCRQAIIERDEMVEVLKSYATADKIGCDICGVSNEKAETLLKKLGEL